MEHFDLIVIGGGPSGYAGAMRAIDFGKKVLLIEKKKIGGAGVYVSVDAAHVQIGVQIVCEAQLNLSADSADADASLAKSRNRYRENAADARDLRVAECLGNVNPPAYAAQPQGAVDLADLYRPADRVEF